MNLIVKSRHMAITPALQEYVQDKIGKSSKIIEYMLKDAEVELWVEKNPSIENNQVCEVTLYTKGPVIRAREASTDMYAAIDSAADKLDRQLRKFKGKLVDRRSGKHQSVMPEPTTPGELAEEVEREIVKKKQVKVRAMSEEQAVLELELLGHDFFVFTHEETGDVSVVYLRDDGDYGLIQPVPEQ